ncbi:MAG: hypothetical protein ACE5LV_06675, partial [Candidatus Aminicenantales bacterium]
VREELGLATVHYFVHHFEGEIQVSGSHREFPHRPLALLAFDREETLPSQLARSLGQNKGPG